MESRAWAQSPQVDLQVSGISFTSAPSVGVPTLAVAQLANRGSSSSGGFNVKWFLDGVQVGYGYHVPLAAGVVSNGNVRFWWTPTAGAHTLQFVADVDRQVQESNEANNAAQVTVGGAGSSTPLRNNMVITSNIVAAPGTYTFQDPEEDGALIVGADNITIDLNGATLDGGSFLGYGIRNDGHSNVNIINGTIRGYRAGILLQNASGNRILSNTLSGNRNRPVRHNADDFLGVWGEWAEQLAKDQIGDGVVLRDSDHTLIQGNRMNGQQSGVGLFDSDANTISRNDMSNNEGWGIHLHRSSDNTIQDNLANNIYDRQSTYCHDVQQDGCDTAALLIIKGSHRNQVTRNELKNSGDGFFLAGYYEGSNDNIVTGNDGSAAKHLAFEATFAEGNVFESNIATGAGRAGFWLGGSTNTIVRNNTITGNGGAGILNEGTRDIVIENNLIADNRGGGIGVMPLNGHPVSAGYQLIQNRIKNNLGYGIRIDDALQGSFFDGNVFEDNEVGIRVGSVSALSTQVTASTFGCSGGCFYGEGNLQLQPSSDYYMCQPQCFAKCSACEQISYGGTFSGLASSLGTSQAQFQFAYTGSTTGYHLDLGLSADMSWGVYLDFANGAVSPVSTPSPQRWDAYTCGRTFYWRVWDQERRVSSPIQAATTPACSGTFSNLTSSLGTSQALFQFAYSGNTTSYHVDLSTRADMSWDVYLDFASGTTSPVVTPNPRRWTAYTCGRTLYWRVWDRDRRVSSPIQAASTPSCGGAFFSLASSLGATQSQFHFLFTGATTGYHVDLSTRADMSWDVYLDFATGAAGPLVTANPQQRWGAYTCGRTLYWRVWDRDRRVSSPIQTALTFACPRTFSSP